VSTAPERTVPDPGFRGDDGSVDPRLDAALAAHAEGRMGEAELLAALAAARLLVPVVAVPADETAVDEPGTGAGPRREKQTDMALVTVRAPSGRTALPAFTSLDTLSAWSPQARPVPVEARRACLAALAEGADALLVDPGSSSSYVLAGPALRALAEGRAPLPPLADPAVHAAVEAAVRDEPAFARVQLLPGRDSDLTVGAVLAAGATAELAGQAARRVAATLAEDAVIRDRLGRGLELVVLPPGYEVPAPDAPGD
jgi:hypothetical protein